LEHIFITHTLLTFASWRRNSKDIAGTTRRQMPKYTAVYEKLHIFLRCVSAQNLKWKYSSVTGQMQVCV